MLTDHDTLSAAAPCLATTCRFPTAASPARRSLRKIFDCWWETFDIQAFIANNYSEEIQKAIILPPKPKMLSLLEIIEQAGRRRSEG